MWNSSQQINPEMMNEFIRRLMDPFNDDYSEFYKNMYNTDGIDIKSIFQRV